MLLFLLVLNTLMIGMWWEGWVWMVLELGFGFVHGGERERERERDLNQIGERYYFGLYILLRKYIILICSMGK